MLNFYRPFRSSEQGDSLRKWGKEQSDGVHVDQTSIKRKQKFNLRLINTVHSFFFHYLDKEKIQRHRKRTTKVAYVSEARTD